MEISEKTVFLSLSLHKANLLGWQVKLGMSYATASQTIAPNLPLKLELSARPPTKSTAPVRVCQCDRFETERKGKNIK